MKQTKQPTTLVWSVKKAIGIEKRMVIFIYFKKLILLLKCVA